MNTVPNSSDDPILTTREAARMLGVAVSTAQQWMESGALPVWKTPGGHRRVRLSAVRRLLAEFGATCPRPAGGVQDGAVPAVQPEAPLEDEFRPLPQPGYPVPGNEAARLAAVAASGLMDTPAEDVFDRITWLAAQVTDCPMALVTLLSSHRQWFKSRIGVDLTETPRDWSFCSHAITQESPFMVEDAEHDARFRDNPLVTGEPRIRFYAAFPLVDAQGMRLGTLCVLDREARRLRFRELRALRELAAIASDEIRRRGGG